MIHRNRAQHHSHHRARLAVEVLERRELLSTSPALLAVPSGIGAASAAPAATSFTTITTFSTIVTSGAAAGFTETLGITITFSISVAVPDFSAAVAGPGAGRVATPIADSPIAVNTTFTTIVLLSAIPGTQGVPFIYPYNLMPFPRVATTITPPAEKIAPPKTPAPDQGFFIVGDEKALQDAFDADLGTNPPRPPVPAPVPLSPQAPLPADVPPGSIEVVAYDAALVAYAEAKSEANAGFAEQLAMALEPQAALPRRSLGMAAVAVVLGCGAFQGTVVSERNRVALPHARNTMA
jgi:hypothetical protein